VDSTGLFMEEQENPAYTVGFTGGLPVIKTPLAAKSTWTVKTTAAVNGASGTSTGTAKITAKTSPMVLVTVPAGYFLAYPIAYTLKVSGQGGASSSEWTDYFAPYFGAVKTEYKKSGVKTAQMTRFSIGGGTVTSPPPVITAISPKSATRGDGIQVTGHQFGSSQGTATIRIGNLDCGRIWSWTDNSIEFAVPDTAVSGAVTVVTDTWTSNDSFRLTIVVPPEVTEVTPASGKKGSAVQVLGQDFGTVPGKVKFGTAIAKVQQWGDTSITCTVPKTMRPGTYPITVTNSQGKSTLPGAFIVVK